MWINKAPVAILSCFILAGCGAVVRPPSARPLQSGDPCSPVLILGGRIAWPAVLVSIPSPVYPPGASEQGHEGLVTLRVIVGEDGAICAVTVAESSGYPELDEAGRIAVLGATFVPALTADGERCASEVQVPTRFYHD